MYMYIVGINTGLAPMYLSEIAPVSLRGLCGVFNQLSITFGVFMSEIIGLQGVLGRKDTWQFALGKYDYNPTPEVRGNLLFLVWTPFALVSAFTSYIFFCV